MKDTAYSKQTIFIKMLMWGLFLAVIHIVLERVLAYVATDVALVAFVRPLNIAIILCDAMGFFVTYSLLTLSVSRIGTGGSSAAILLTVVLTLVKHLGNWLVFLISENVTSAIDWHLSAMTAASSILIELVQHATIILALALIFSPRRSLENPVKVGLLSVSGIMVAINVISRIITDVEYGAPSSSAEIWVMVAYYAFDIVLYGVVGYVLMRTIFNRQN